MISLSLLPPSCMVAPIRDMGNITANTLTICEPTYNMAVNDDIDMEVNSFNSLFQSTSNNFDEVWGHLLAQSAHSPRTPSISLSECEESYVERLEKMNDKMDKDEPIITIIREPSIGSIQLKYETPKS